MKTPVKTFRCPEARWQRAQKRASELNVNMSQLLNWCVETFAEGGFPGFEATVSPVLRDVTLDDIRAAVAVARVIRADLDEKGFGRER